MKPKIMKLIGRCVESGVAIGYARAHKHTDKPDESAITQAITAAIENELYEWFDFEDDAIGDEVVASTESQSLQPYASFHVGFYDEIMVYAGEDGWVKRRCFNICAENGRHVAHTIDDKKFAQALVDALNKSAAAGYGAGRADDQSAG